MYGYCGLNSVCRFVIVMLRKLVMNVLNFGWCVVLLCDGLLVMFYVIV